MQVLDSDTLLALDGAATAAGRRGLSDDDRPRVDPRGRHLLTGLGEADMEGWHLGRVLAKLDGEREPTEVYLAMRATDAENLPSVIDSLRDA